MNKFSLFCFAFILCSLYLSTETKTLHKRQTLEVNKSKIGASEENWALVGNIPTPTNGRLRLSDEPGEYRAQLERLTNNKREDERSRLTKRWIRDGDIDKERHYTGSDGSRYERERHRDERERHRDERERHRDERDRYRDRDSDRDGSRRHGTRDGEGRLY